MKALAVAVLLISTNACAQANSQGHISEYPTPTIREEQVIVVGGVRETWRLLWTAMPTPYCGPSEDAFTCPCTGFAYGEIGDLYLVRLRNGSEIDRLRLTPFFTEEPGAVVQRWPADYDEDFNQWKRADFSAVVTKRPTAQVMHFADFDHDGRATEFYLQTEAAPCGKNAGIVIGLSKTNPRLHVFGTASNPRKPLYLQVWEWEALRDAKSGPVDLVDWPCFDHGAETQTEIRLFWSAQGIDGVRREFTCPSNNRARRLISEKPLLPAKQR